MAETFTGSSSCIAADVKGTPQRFYDTSLHNNSHSHSVCKHMYIYLTSICSRNSKFQLSLLTFSSVHLRSRGANIFFCQTANGGSSTAKSKNKNGCRVS